LLGCLGLVTPKQIEGSPEHPPTTRRQWSAPKFPQPFDRLAGAPPDPGLLDWRSAAGDKASP